MGIGPTFAAWEAAVLPLDDTRSCELVGTCVPNLRLAYGVTQEFGKSVGVDGAGKEP